MTDKTMMLLASYLDDGGRHTEAENVRNGVDLESYENEILLIEWLTRHISQNAERGEAVACIDFRPVGLPRIVWFKQQKGRLGKLDVYAYQPTALSATPSPAIDIAAVPDVFLPNGKRMMWEDSIGRKWPCTITRYTPATYDAVLDDGTSALGYARGRFSEIAAAAPEVTNVSPE